MDLSALNQEMLIQYFNLGVLAIVVLFGLIGFFRGTYKSLFYLIATAVIFGVGWLVMQPVITFLLNFDLSSYNLVVYEVQITSINAAVPAFVEQMFPQLAGAFTGDTLTQELITGLLSMVVKIVYFILLIVLAFSVFKVITDIFWLIFRPKKKAGKRKKKSFLSRLGGFGIGAAKGAFYVLLICVPLVGIASIAGSLTEVAEDQSEDLSYQLVFVGNSVTLVESPENLQTSPLGEYGAILELLGFYKKSVAGEVFGTLKADEFIFDNLMSFQVNDVDVQLRKELQTIATAFSKAETILEGGFSLDKLATTDPDLLKEIIDDITDLDLIKVLMPVGVEIALLMEDEEGNRIIDQLPNDPDNPDDDFVIADLRTIDFAADFASLGYALVDVLSLLPSEGEEIDYFNLDGELVEEIFTNVGNLEIIDTFAPIAVSYLVSMEEFGSALTQVGMTAEDLGIYDVDSWGAEIANVGTIYRRLADLQIQNIQNFGGEDFDPVEAFQYVTEDKVDLLSTALFNSTLISNAIPVLVNQMSSQFLTGEFADLISFDGITWNAAEFSSIFNATVTLVKSGLLTSTSTNPFENLTEDNVDDLAKYLSQSNLIKKNLNNLIDMLLGGLDIFDDTTELIMLEDDEWTQAELTSIFQAARIIASQDLENLMSLEDEVIEDLALYLSGSRFIIKNLSGIIDKLLGSLDIFGPDTEILTLTEEEWTQTELEALLKAGKLISSTDLEDLGALTDDTIEDLALYLSNSQFIIKNLSGIIDELLGSLDIFGPDTEILTLSEEEWTQTELESLFKAGKLISSTDLEDLGALTNETIDDLALYLSGSKFITKNLNGIIEELLAGLNMFGDDVELVTILEEEWTQTELTSLFKAGQIISSQDMDNLTNLDDETIEELSYHLAHSKFITSNLNPILDTALESISLGDDIELGRVDDWSDSEKAETELVSIFKSAKIITDKGSDADAFLDITDDELDILLGSELISETLVNVLKAYSAEGKELDFLVGANDEGVVWYDTDEVDCVFTIEGTILTITPTEGTNKYNIYADGEKVAATRDLTFDLSTLTLDNPTPTYTVKGFDEGELRKIFTAIGALASSLSSGTGFSTDLITDLTDDEIDNILVSDILVQSIIAQIEEFSTGENAFVTIPEGDLTSIDQDIKLAAWKNQNNEGILVEGELAKVFKGLRILLAGTELDSFGIDTITGLTDSDIYEILKSEVLSESIIVKIEEEALKVDAIIAIPTGEGLDDPEDRSAWLNQYELDQYGRYVYDEFDVISVLQDGELTRCLRALKVVLEGSTIENIDIGNLFDETNRETVLSSLIIEETLINKIEQEANKVDAIISIPNNIKNDPTLWKGQNGELRRIINALDYILGDGGSIESFELDIEAILLEKDEILKSDVIVETIIVKISEQNEINIPTGTGYGLNDPDDRSAWKNTYVLDENDDYTYDEFDQVVISEYGEAARLLNAVDLLITPDPITGERSLDNISFDITQLFDDANEDTFLQSLVLCETIVHKIHDTATTSSSLYIPSELYVNAIDDNTPFNRNKWFSDYSGATVVKGEIAHLLDAADIIMGEGDDFNSITFDINIAFDPINQVILLRSKVISETIVQKIAEEAAKEGAMLALPSDEYVNDIELDDSRDKWFNTYDASGVLLETNELANMLIAAKHIIGEGTFENITFDLAVAFDPVIQEDILKSFVISETIVQQINKEATNGTLNLPTTDYLESPDAPERDGWFNSYVGGNLVKGELAYLLDAAHELLGEDADFAGMNFDLSAAYDNDKQLIILRSYVISETIVQKIAEEATKEGAMLSMPFAPYVNDLSQETSRDKWYNDYSGATVVKGEIAHLLDAAEYLLGGGSFENLTFDLSAAFDSASQEIILKSYVISETIVQQIYKETQSGNLSLPTVNYVENPAGSGRTTWYNSYQEETLVKGEIAHLLDAAYELLGEDADFSGMNFDLSAAYDDIKQEKILRSFVISETIVQKIAEEAAKPAAILALPSTEYVNDLTLEASRNKWFNDYSGETVVKGEIARLLDACEHLLGGGSFENIDFDLSAAFNPLTQETILKSFVISETIVQQIYSETQSGNLSLPTTLYLEHPTAPERDTWYNSYVGLTLVKGEIAYLLDAANELLGEDADFTGMNFDLSAAYDDDKQETILRSFVISETIVQKIAEEAAKPAAILTLPSAEYVNDLTLETSRDKWFNDYSGESVVKGEVARLLDACEYLLGGGSFENIDFDLSAAFDPLTQETILKSFVISETIVQQIYSETQSGNLSLPTTLYLEHPTAPERDSWFNSYVGGSLVKGEVAYLLDAANELLGEDADFTGMNFDLSAAYDDTKQLTILRSLVISETIVQKIVDESEKPAAILTLPSVDYVNDVSLDNSRNKWFNDYSGETVIKGEIARLLDACEHLLGGGSFENIDFDLSAAFNPLTQETILKSFVISETIVQQIYSETQSGNLSLPTTVYLEHPTAPERDTWYNSYVGGSLVKGEVAYLLDAANELLGEDADFTGMNFDLSAAYDDDKQLVILKSYVISETIVQKIVDESEKPAAILTLPSVDYVNDVSLDDSRNKWFNDYSGESVVKGEVARLLDACEHLLGGGNFENIDFDLSAAFDPLTQETILKSFVISETIVQQIYSETQSGNLSLPTTLYLEHPTAPERDTWFNSYVGETLVKGEVAYLLDAANELLGEGASFTGMNFDLSAAYDDTKQLVILKSYVISETIVQKVVDESEKPGAILTLPSVDYVNDVSIDDSRNKWFNDYSGATVIKGELARLLDSCEYLLGGGTFENIDFDLSAAFNPLTQETILKSFVISETIVQQIYSETQSGNLSLPTTLYLEHPTAPERDTWFNSYVGGSLVKGEVAYLLDAANELLGEGASFTGMNFDLSAAYDDEKQLTILQSLVISETIVQKVIDESEKPGAILTIPSVTYVNNVTSDQSRDKWFNDYSGATVAKGELARLLDSCEYLLGGGTFENISFDLSAAFDPLTQETILKSHIIAETIVQIVIDESTAGTIKIPSTTYVNATADPSRDKWFNSYVGETLVKGELAYLLDAADQILPDGADFSGINFNLETLFDSNSQKIVLRSSVFSETIISKIMDQDGSAVNVPTNDLEGNSLSDASDRTPWFNQYVGNDVNKYGEIAKMLNATNAILGGSGTFETMSFDINVLFDDTKQGIVLKSLVLSETIVQKIFANTTAISDIPNVDLRNRALKDATNRIAWYNEYDNTDVLVEENELAKFLDAIALILNGNDFASMGAITIDSILDLTFVITLDANMDIVTSEFATLVDSVVMENIVAPLVQTVATTVMVDYLVVPSGGYNWYKKDLITGFDPSTMDVNIYDTSSFLESLYTMHKSGIDYTNLGATPVSALDDPTIIELSKAMVISRSFKGSTAFMYNAILQPTYNAMPASIPGVATKKSWDDVKFIQADYDGVKVAAYNNLVAKFTELKQTETVTFMGMDYEISTAFYDLN